VGWYAATKFPLQTEARDFAEKILDEGTHWVYLAIIFLIVFLVARWLWRRRKDSRQESVREGTRQEQNEPRDRREDCSIRSR
jgi:hypothetical protein